MRVLPDGIAKPTEIGEETEKPNDQQRTRMGQTGVKKERPCRASAPPVVPQPPDSAPGQAKLLGGSQWWHDCRSHVSAALVLPAKYVYSRPLAYIMALARSCAVGDGAGIWGFSNCPRSTHACYPVQSRLKMPQPRVRLHITRLGTRLVEDPTKEGRAKEMLSGLPTATALSQN